MSRQVWLVGVVMVGLAAQMAKAGPVINGIGGVTDTSAGITNGKVDMSIGTAYNGKTVVNNEPGIYTWTIKGSGFGGQTGTVLLAGRAAPVLAWTDTAIRVNVSGAQINPARPWGWGPMSTTLRVKTAAGQAADILYVARQGCTWRALPHDLLPYRIIFHCFQVWQDDDALRRLPFPVCPLGLS